MNSTYTNTIITQLFESQILSIDIDFRIILF